jgi:hypothetical protein
VRSFKNKEAGAFVNALIEGDNPERTMQARELGGIAGEQRKILRHGDGGDQQGKPTRSGIAPGLAQLCARSMCCWLSTNAYTATALGADRADDLDRSAPWFGEIQSRWCLPRKNAWVRSVDGDHQSG